MVMTFMMFMKRRKGEGEEIRDQRRAKGKVCIHLSVHEHFSILL